MQVLICGSSPFLSTDVHFVLGAWFFGLSIILQYRGHAPVNERIKLCTVSDCDTPASYCPNGTSVPTWCKTHAPDSTTISQCSIPRCVELGMYGLENDDKKYCKVIVMWKNQHE